jgi:hypothetical protein
MPKMKVMDLDDEVFGTLQEDVIACMDYLRQVSGGMVKGNISNYPIFVAHRNELDLGIPITNRLEMDMSWSFSASHLEDFVNKGIIHINKVEVFKGAFKDPGKYLCLFVADDDFSNFVFMPFDNTGITAISKEQLN